MWIYDLCTEVCNGVSPAAPAVALLTHTRSHKKRRNESCWELELCSIRVTTYLQTVGGKLPLCDSSAKRHTCTFDSGPASPNYTAKSEGGMDARRRRREGDDRVWAEWKTHTHTHAGCTCVSNSINKYICVHTNTYANEMSSFKLLWCELKCIEPTFRKRQKINPNRTKDTVLDFWQWIYEKKY